MSAVRPRVKVRRATARLKIIRFMKFLRGPDTLRFRHLLFKKVPSNARHHPPAHNCDGDNLSMTAIVRRVGCMPLLGAAPSHIPAPTSYGLPPTRSTHLAPRAP